MKVSIAKSVVWGLMIKSFGCCVKMLYTHPKVARLWAYLLVLLLSTHLAASFPNINPTNQQQQQNFLSQLNKGFFQAPPQVEETIDEVQRILANDPTLPRLTRGEIEELYEKVTREEYEKSVEAGDMGRADSMRALMLVLPFNTDNNTEENLQELYTRPPVTKVIDGYSSHQPIKFLTPDPTALPKTTQNNWNQQVSATTFKPIYNLPARVAPSPTTYHPPPPAIMQQMATPASLDQPYNQQAGSAMPYAFDYNPNPKLTQRFSSHYNAKNADFLRKPKTTTTSTVKPVADVLESLGIVGQPQSRHRYSAAQSDYYVAESAPRPVISSYSPSAADLQNYHGAQSLSPKIRPDAYTNFKPLNIGEELRVKPEVESYLTRFGIVGGRKRKELDKTASLRNSAVREQASAESEIATAKVPSASGSKERKAKPNSNAELMKLLENLQELERLNAKAKVASTTARPTTTKRTTTTTTTTSTTSTTTTKAPTTSSDLLTHGTPLLIEPKKPRRRIDPNIDLAFANSGNQQSSPTSTQQLAKLLANLQELEKLQINPDNVLKKTMAEQLAAVPAASTAAPVRSPVLTNRFSEFAAQPTARPQTDAEQLQQVLKQLQLLERQNMRASSTTTTTTTTTPRPQRAKPAAGGVPPINDLQQLRMLLSNEAELQRLYEQARAGQKLTLTTRPPRTTTPRPTTTTTSTTTTTTERPADSFDFNNLVQLQKYFAAMEQDRARTTTSTTTTTSTSTTTPAPPTTTATPSRTVKKSNVDQAQLQELINRVHELERFNTQKDTSYEPIKPTDASFPILGFTTRNVRTQQIPKELPVNDFAHLQKLYKQVQEAEEASYGQVEISTAGTVSKIEHAQNGKRTQNFAQRIIDITNDTGSGSSLQAVDPDDFVQLQKLLRKVQELERVKIKTSTNSDTQRRNGSISGTPATNLVTSASIRTQNVHHANSAHVVYAERPKTYDNIAEIIQETDNLEDFKLDLPAYEATTPQPRPKLTTSEQSSSQELHDLAYSRLANPMQSAEGPREKNKYQQLLSNLEDAERMSYSNMQPPIIQKTFTKEPPRFIATRKPADLQKSKTPMSDKQMELKELQKLLNNAQELEKLGVTLPKELSMQIESKLMTAMPMTALEAESERLPTTTSSPYLYDSEQPREHTAVFSLTTQKSATPKVTTSTSTESSVQLPIFSATKIIEAAIKRAANKIGVPTEATQAKGFQRRHAASNEERDLATGADDMDDDLMGQFSELNYQLAALPQEATRTQRSNEPTTLQSNDKELQRLIANLQELQKLNINLTPEQVQTADSKYLETLKQQLSETEETKKGRRQSGATTTTSTTVKPTTTTSAPTRLQLDLSLDDGDKATSSGDTTADSSTTTSTTTEESRNGSLTDLEESFGPNPVADMTTEAPKKKNGFYFLADWNSFLEVGDGDDQVVVRFSPKIGDPRIFLPVKIP